MISAGTIQEMELRGTTTARRRIRRSRRGNRYVMKLEELMQGVEHLRIRGSADVTIEGVTVDSRKVRPGYLFAALAGERADGHDYVAAAIDRGAVAVLTAPMDMNWPGVAHIEAMDTRQAIAEAAVSYYRNPAASLCMVGITGTNGKTTTATMVRGILRAADMNPGILGTLAYEIGERAIPGGRTTPEATELQALLASMVENGCRAAVMEVSSHALVQKRVHGVDYDVTVFTNLSRDHLDYHGSMDDYFATKLQLLAAAGTGRKRAVVVINVDDQWGRCIPDLGVVEAETLTCAFTRAADVRGEDLVVHADGCNFSVRTPWGAAEVRLPLLGEFNACNALASIAAAGAAGVDLDVIVAALAQAEPVPGRLQEVAVGRPFRVFVDYAHTEQALERALCSLRPLTRGRLIVVFGCGGNRDTSKRRPMGAVAQRFADHTIVTSDNPRQEDPAAIIAEICAGLTDPSVYEVIEDRAAAIQSALAPAAAGDIVLIAGKGHENYQELANTVIPFDDCAVVRDLLC